VPVRQLPQLHQEADHDDEVEQQEAVVNDGVDRVADGDVAAVRAHLLPRAAHADAVGVGGELHEGQDKRQAQAERVDDVTRQLQGFQAVHEQGF
jgi:hypothetical protein